MLILLTNDDGIMAPGIIALHRELAKLGEVEVVAPETVQSATGHGITISAPLLTSKVTIEGAFTGTAVDGRPADCVKLAIKQILDRKPDLVVSGMNSGANVGVNHIYSGTVAAAIEAGFLGLPAIAVSLHLHKDVPTDYTRTSAWALEAIKLVLEQGLDGGEVVSINIPALPAGESPKGVKIVRQCTRAFMDQYERRLDPRGREYFWNSSVFTLGHTDADTDVAAIRDKYIAITPLQFDLTNHAMTHRWQQRSWELK